MRMNDGVRHLAQSSFVPMFGRLLTLLRLFSFLQQNVLVSSELSSVKLGDFGLGRSTMDREKTLTYEVVTLWYRCPELLLGNNQYSESIDIWSIGCVIGELLIGYPLFPGDSELDTLLRIFKIFGTPTNKYSWPTNSIEPFKTFPKFPGILNLPGNSGRLIPNNEYADSLVRSMLSIDPNRRLSAGEYLKHPFFTSI